MRECFGYSRSGGCDNSPQDSGAGACLYCSIAHDLHDNFSVFQSSNFRTGQPGVAAVRLIAAGGSLLVHALGALALSIYLPQSRLAAQPATPLEVRLLNQAMPQRGPVASAPPPTSRQPPRAAVVPPAPMLLQAMPTAPKPEGSAPALPQTFAVTPATSVEPSPATVVAVPKSGSAGIAVEVNPRQSQETAGVRSTSPPTEPLVAARFDAAYLANPKPAYPMASRRLGEAGVVRLRVLVGSEGQALQVELDRGSGYSRLDRAALEAVAGWRFIPARRGDLAVASWVVVPIEFALN